MGGELGPLEHQTRANLQKPPIAQAVHCLHRDGFSVLLIAEILKLDRVAVEQILGEGSP